MFLNKTKIKKLRSRFEYEIKVEICIQSCNVNRTLEKTEGTTKNGQSRDIGKIRHKTQDVHNKEHNIS